jgi:hypothetical protein
VPTAGAPAVNAEHFPEKVSWGNLPQKLSTFDRGGWFYLLG